MRQHLPLPASGGKDNGSGYTTEQLFWEVSPQIRGFPTILKAQSEQWGYFKLANKYNAINKSVFVTRKITHLNVLACIFGKEPLKLLKERSLQELVTLQA